MDSATRHLKGVKVAAYHGGCGWAASWHWALWSGAYTFFTHPSPDRRQAAHVSICSGLGQALKFPPLWISLESNGKRAFWGKSWPGSFWSQILGFWWLASKQLQVPFWPNSWPGAFWRQIWQNQSFETLAQKRPLKTKQALKAVFLRPSLGLPPQGFLLGVYLGYSRSL